MNKLIITLFCLLTDTLLFGSSATNDGEAILRKSGFFAKNHLALQTCADLTGNWTGSCTNSEGSEETSTIVIEQTLCESIKVDGEWWPLGGSSSKVNTESERVMTNTRNFYWSDNSKVINVITSVSARLLNKTKLWDGKLTGRYFLDGNHRLATETAWNINVTEDRTVKKDQGTTRCSYQRQ